MSASNNEVFFYHQSSGSDYDFTYGQEIGPDSTSPHHPTPGTGVTIGLGYDMSVRDDDEIRNDLIDAGVDPPVAEEFLTASRKTGDDADQWISEHQHRGFCISPCEISLNLDTIHDLDNLIRY